MSITLTLLIIIVTVIASLYAWNNPSVMQRWMMNPYDVDRKQQYFRFVTSGLIHQDYMHLFFNMFTLYFFGNTVELIYRYSYGGLGTWIFLGLYLAGIIFSDLPTYFKHRKNPYYNSLGASGGVSAIVFSSILFRPLNDMYIFPIPFPIPGFIFGGLYMLYSYVQAQRGRDYINHDAHMYGALFGVAFSAMTVPGALTNFIVEISNWRIFGGM